MLLLLPMQAHLSRMPLWQPSNHRYHEGHCRLPFSQPHAYKQSLMFAARPAVMSQTLHGLACSAVQATVGPMQGNEPEEQFAYKYSKPVASHQGHLVLLFAGSRVPAGVGASAGIAGPASSSCKHQSGETADYELGCPSLNSRCPSTCTHKYCSYSLYFSTYWAAEILHTRRFCK